MLRTPGLDPALRGTIGVLEVVEARGGDLKHWCLKEGASFLPSAVGSPGQSDGRQRVEDAALQQGFRTRRSSRRKDGHCLHPREEGSPPAPHAPAMTHECVIPPLPWLSLQNYWRAKQLGYHNASNCLYIFQHAPPAFPVGISPGGAEAQPFSPRPAPSPPPALDNRLPSRSLPG